MNMQVFINGLKVKEFVLPNIKRLMSIEIKVTPHPPPRPRIKMSQELPVNPNFQKIHSVPRRWYQQRENVC